MIKRINFLRIVPPPGLLSLLFGLLATVAVAQADEWDFVVAPYGLLPSISGDTSLGRIDGVDVDVSPGDILEVLEFGAMLQAEAHHQSGFGVLLNYAFMKLGDGASGPLELADIQVDIFQGMLEGYGIYRLKFPSSVLDLYAGARWWDLNIDVDATTPRGSRSYSRDEDWVDPVVGLRWSPQIAEDWRLVAQGDVGGFGVSSDFAWNLQAGVLWDVKKWCSLVLMYRYLAVDYDTGQRGSSDYFQYDTVTQGPIMGAAFRF